MVFRGSLARRVVGDEVGEACGILAGRGNGLCGQRDAMGKF